MDKNTPDSKMEVDKDKPVSETELDMDELENKTDVVHCSGDHVEATNNFLSTINTLKPQIDKIFSEVQKQLPHIDFESTDSDNDEPIFRQHLTEAGVFVKELDTSLSPDDPQHDSSGNLPSHSSGKDKNFSPVDEEENAGLYDNDLAAFRSKLGSPTDDEIKNWRIFVKMMEDAEAEVEKREEADLKRSQELGMTPEIGEISTEKSLTEDAARDVIISETGDSCNFRIEDNNIEVAGDPADNNNLVPETVKKFQQRLQEGMKDMDLAQPQSKFAQEAQSRVDEIMSKYKLQEQLTLSRECLEQLNLDSVLNAPSEENNAMKNMQMLSQSSPKSRSPNGSGDDETQKDVPEELTLIEKLANLSIKTGADAEALRSLDPHTGAAKTSPELKAESQIADKSQGADNPNIADESCVSDAGWQASGTSTASAGTSTASAGTSTASAGTSTASAGTSTASAGTSTSKDTEKSGIEHDRLKHVKRDSEPPTVVLDLRISSCIDEQKQKKKQKEQEAIKSVLRVLRVLEDPSTESSSSEDETDENYAWSLTRGKIKELIASHALKKKDTDNRASGTTRDIVHDASEAKVDSVHDASKAKVDSVHDASKAKVDSVHDVSKATVDIVHDASKAKVDSVPDTSKAKVDSVHDTSKAKVDSVHDVSKAKVDIVHDASKAKVDIVHDASKAKVDSVHVSKAKGDVIPDASKAKGDVIPDASIAKGDIIHDTQITKRKRVHVALDTKKDIVHLESESKVDMVYGAHSCADVEKQQYGATKTDLGVLPEIIIIQESSASDMDTSLQTTQIAATASYQELCQGESTTKKKKSGSRKGKKAKNDDLDKQQREAEKRVGELEKELKWRQEISKSIAAATSTASTQGKQSAAAVTAPLYHIDITFEEPPVPLPRNLSPDRELLLVTVSLSGNSKVLQHRNKPSHSIDTEEGLTATYNALLTYFLSFVPGDETAMLRPCSSNYDPNSAPPFYVIGLQQMFFEEQLKLYVVLTPSETFEAHYYIYMALQRKSQNKREPKGSSRFHHYITKLLSTNTYEQVFPHVRLFNPGSESSRLPEEKGAPPYTYNLSLPKISSKPLSTFVQISSDQHAARKIFNIPMGFHWQTVDNDEVSCSSEDCIADFSNNTENTVSVFYKNIFTQPVAMLAILCRINQEGLELAGVRLLYPSAAQLGNKDERQWEGDALKNIPPVLALAIRGGYAIITWLDTLGPYNPEVARRVNPRSIFAVFGTNATNSPIMYRPLGAGFIQDELARWFGGRAPSAAATSVAIGAPYLKKEEVKVKRGKKSNANSKTMMPVLRPPAALTASSRSDAFLIVSPLCPAGYFGMLVTIIQRRGYSLRGVKRLRLTLKMAGTLGISAEMQKFFCPGVCFGDQDPDKSAEAVAPVTVFMVSNENAGHSAGALIESIMLNLTVSGLLGIVEMRSRVALTSKLLFHATVYTDAFLALFGGSMSQIPDVNQISLRVSSYATKDVNHNEEQVAVVTMIGSYFLHNCGPFLARILNVVPYYLVNFQTPLPERYELLGVKCVQSLTMDQAKLLTPYGTFDKHYQSSVRMIKSEPALVLALRGVNVFSILTHEIQDQQMKMQKNIESRVELHGDLATVTTPRIDCVISKDPKHSDVLVRVFFNENELYPDPYARRLLHFLPESRLYLDATLRLERGLIWKSFCMKHINEMDLTQENVIDAISGQPPITTLLIIKPKAVQKYLTVIMKTAVKEQFTIVGLHMLMLPLKMVTTLIPPAHKKVDSKFKRHIKAYMCGPVVAVALQRPNAIKILYDLVGPNDPVVCRRQNNLLWRAQFGSDIFNNGVYCSLNYYDAVRDLKMVFPDGLCCHLSDLLSAEEIPAPAQDSIIDVELNSRDITVTYDAPQHDQSQETKPEVPATPLVQTTCIAVNPRMMKVNLYHKKVSALDIMDLFLDNEFQFVGCRLVWLTEEQVDSLIAMMRYTGYRARDYLRSGPLLVLAMERENAVVDFQTILKRDTESRRLMHLYGDELIEPDNTEEAEALLKFFFDRLIPGSQVVITSQTGDSEDLHIEDDADGAEEGGAVEAEGDHTDYCAEYVGVELGEDTDDAEEGEGGTEGGATEEADSVWV